MPVTNGCSPGISTARSSSPSGNIQSPKTGKNHKKPPRMSKQAMGTRMIRRWRASSQSIVPLIPGTVCAIMSNCRFNRLCRPLTKCYPFTVAVSKIGCRPSPAMMQPVFCRLRLWAPLASTYGGTATNAEVPLRSCSRQDQLAVCRRTLPLSIATGDALPSVFVARSCWPTRRCREGALHQLFPCS